LLLMASGKLQWTSWSLVARNPLTSPVPLPSIHDRTTTDVARMLRGSQDSIIEVTKGRPHVASLLPDFSEAAADEGADKAAAAEDAARRREQVAAAAAAETKRQQQEAAAAVAEQKARADAGAAAAAAATAAAAAAAVEAAAAAAVEASRNVESDVPSASSLAQTGAWNHVSASDYFLEVDHLRPQTSPTSATSTVQSAELCRPVEDESKTAARTQLVVRDTASSDGREFAAGEELDFHKAGSNGWTLVRTAEAVFCWLPSEDLVFKSSDFGKSEASDVAKNERATMLEQMLAREKAELDSVKVSLERVRSRGSTPSSTPSRGLVSEGNAANSADTNNLPQPSTLPTFSSARTAVDSTRPPEVPVFKSSDFGKSEASDVAKNERAAMLEQMLAREKAELDSVKVSLERVRSRGSTPSSTPSRGLVSEWNAANSADTNNLPQPSSRPLSTPAQDHVQARVAPTLPEANLPTASPHILPTLSSAPTAVDSVADSTRPSEATRKEDVAVTRGPNGKLGIKFLNAESGPHTIEKLAPQGAAALSQRLFPGDLVYAINGRSIEDLHTGQLLSVLQGAPETVVRLLVSRKPVNATCVSVYLCDGGCGFKGSFDEVASHERGCEKLLKNEPDFTTTEALKSDSRGPTGDFGSVISNGAGQKAADETESSRQKGQSAFRASANKFKVPPPPAIHTIEARPDRAIQPPEAEISVTGDPTLEGGEKVSIARGPRGNLGIQVYFDHTVRDGTWCIHDLIPGVRFCFCSKSPLA